MKANILAINKCLTAEEFRLCRARCNKYKFRKERMKLWSLAVLDKVFLLFIFLAILILVQLPWHGLLKSTHTHTNFFMTSVSTLPPSSSWRRTQRLSHGNLSTSLGSRLGYRQWLAQDYPPRIQGWIEFWTRLPQSEWTSCLLCHTPTLFSTKAWLVCRIWIH